MNCYDLIKGMFYEMNNADFELFCKVLAYSSKVLEGCFVPEIGADLALKEGLLLAKIHNLKVSWIEVDDVNVAAGVNSSSCIIMDETPFISDASLDGCLSLLSRYTPSKNEANRAVVLLSSESNQEYKVSIIV
ncbi:hypothetical protein Dsin_016347 [Dipteronia sinensis]|uniref:Uncharacterized protein n=1 Tax=Dipteronia sinensis TaxID=43782 RepID=A0AAE0E5E4_9ROSI|nr:hypothetical protein Dsin_016347 [Dipteronia sinensis]